MENNDCTVFLQWALPRLELRWPGFRKVRGQVCKRLTRRMHAIGLSDFAAYRARLEADPSEWCVLDEYCHITISRFFRDRGMFEILRRQVLPDIALRATREGRNAYAWSAGCASGEEAYTLRIVWDLEVARAHPGVSLSIIGSDVDEAMLARAHEGCFDATSLRELPLPLVEQAFDRIGSKYCVKPRHRGGVEFIEHDLRSQAPAHLFDLILCRYVAFTYFALSLQRRVLPRMLERLRPQGYFVMGTHERLPDDPAELATLKTAPQIFQKRGA